MPVNQTHKSVSKGASKYRYLLLFTLPALLFYVTFSVYPLFRTFFISLFQTSDNSDTFIGLDNYIYLFTNPTQSGQFWNALGNSFEFFAIHLVVQLPVALLMAALITSDAVRKMTGFYRTILFIPATLSVVIVGFIWRMIISPLWGLVDFPLLGTEATALPTLALMSIWEWIGIPMIFLYTALLAVPRDVIEAATVDGASGLRTFWSVKFPLIAPQFGLITILTFIWTMNGFDLIYSLMGGAPGPDYSTDILGTFFFRSFFGFNNTSGDADFGAAVATTIFLIILIFTAGYFYVLQRRLKPHEL
ncbi:MAG: carbohydrate ABC transporter permease [Rhodoglobus sp.]